MNATSGVISGTPTTAGPYTVALTFTDAYGDRASKSLPLTIDAVLVITTTSPLPSGTAGVAYSETFTATGGSGTLTWTILNGTLPAGLSLNSVSGTLSGTPTTANTYSFVVEVSDTSGDTASQTFSLTIASAAPIVITTVSPLPAATDLSAYSTIIAGSGGTAPYNWSVISGSMPAGLMFTPVVTSGSTPTASVTGTPSTAGTFSFTVQLAGSLSGQVTTKTFSLTVNPQLIITSTTLPAAEVGVVYSAQLTFQGGTPPASWSLSAGALPSGLTLNSAGLITGTPAGSAGTSSFTAQVSDSAGAVASQPLSISVSAHLTITTTSPLPAATVGTAYSLTFAATGGVTPYTWTATGLPAWLTLTSAGVLSGTPPTAVPVSFTVTVTDANHNTATLNAMLPANPALLQITTTSPLPAATVGAAYSLTFAASGGTTPYTWIATGLPAWLTLTSAGVLSGTPPTAAPVSFAVTVTDANHNTATLNATLPVNPATLLITTTSPLPPGMAGTSYSQTLTATGGTTPYTWSATGLPTWLSLTIAGVLSGTPPTASSVSLTVTVMDANHNSATASLSLTVNAATLQITTTSPLPAATVGTAYTQTFTGSGGVTPYTWTAAGLPAWLTLTAAGVLSGTPSSAGPITFAVSLADSSHQITSAVFNLTVNSAALQITTNPTLPAGTAGSAYTQTFAASGGTPPYAWSGTKLPSWLTVSPAGVLSGTPPAAGSFTFNITVTDSTNTSVTITATLLVNPVALSIITASTLPNATAGTPYSQTLAAAGGTPPYSWAASNLPAWLTLSSAGVLSGTPTSAAPAATFSVTVTDSKKNTGAGNFTVTINPPALGITTTALPAAVVGSAYNFSLTASGGVAPYTWTASGLPSPFTLSSSGALTGTPTQTATITFSAMVTDSAGNKAQSNFTLQVNTSTLQITSPAAISAVEGQLLSFTFTATGGKPPYVWSATALPPGLLLSSTGVLSGTPVNGGSVAFRVTVSDSASNSSTASETLTVNAPSFQITTTSPLPSATVGQPYSVKFSSNTTSGVTWSATGVPPGLTLTSGGVLQGTPTSPGAFTLVVTATNSAGATASSQFALTASALKLQITTTSLPQASTASFYSQALQATGGVAPYTWTVVSGALPAGLMLSSSGTITGQPTTAGQVQFTAEVTDSASSSVTQSFTLAVINGGPATPSIVSPTILSFATIGSNYSFDLSAIGGQPPYTWSVISGSLPAGLTLSSGGVISGDATTAGTGLFSVQLTDLSGNQASKSFSLLVVDPAIPAATSPSPLPDGLINQSYYYQFSAVGGQPPYYWSIASGAVPSGLDFDPASGVISGVPNTPGVSNFSLLIADSTGQVETVRPVSRSALSRRTGSTSPRPRPYPVQRWGSPTRKICLFRAAVHLIPGP